MVTGRPKPPLVLSDEERLQLNAVAKSRSLPPVFERVSRRFTWIREA